MKPSTYHNIGKLRLLEDHYFGHQFYLSDDFVSDQNEISVSGLDVLGGSEVNGNGFDQSSIFQDFVSKLKGRDRFLGFASITFQGMLDPGEFNLVFLPYLFNKFDGSRRMGSMSRIL